MRLLERTSTGDICLKYFPDNDRIPPYAILSHTWGSDEVTFKDLVDGTGTRKDGYNKIRFCGDEARRQNLRYFWVDTCCIDKTNSVELQETINRMFRWYLNAARCYVYLADISSPPSNADNKTPIEQAWEVGLWRSRWFTRGWTLQELIAPKSVEFFSKEGVFLGNKKTLEQHIHDITQIPVEALRGRPLSDFGVADRMAWASKRDTSCEEDQAYCLLGIFDVSMPLLYSEGKEKAFGRLREEIKNRALSSIPSDADGKDNDNAIATEPTSCSKKRHRTPSDVDELAAEPLSKTQRLSTLSKEQKADFLNTLEFEQMDARQMIIKKAHAKTCKWLLSKPEYVDWLDASKRTQHNGFLWIKGKPGTGKSTLMKFTLADVRKKVKDTIIIAFFFNARGAQLEKSTTGMYQSLLLQLLKHPVLQDVFHSIELAPYYTVGSHHHQWSVESLKSLFRQAVLSLGKSSLTCFIDALDECGEDEIRDMVSFFRILSEDATSAGLLFRVCYASRHYPHITLETCASFILEGQEGHTQDIVNYIDSELHIKERKLAERIRTEMLSKAAGIFIWVILVVEILNKEYDGGRVHVLRQKLRDIPSDLHTLFRDILTRDQGHRDELLLCIQWVLFARQPLKPIQLYFAILCGVPSAAVSDWDPAEITATVIERFILNSSKGLVEVTKAKHPTAQFIHESVRDFLLKDNGLETIWPDVSVNLGGKSHEQLKQCCIYQLNVATDTPLPLDLPSPLPEASSQEGAALRQSIQDTFPFLHYATKNVLYHADAAEAHGISQTSFMDNFEREKWIELNNRMERYRTRRYTPKASLLYILAEHNAAALIRAHPANRDCFAKEDERYGTPMFAALATESNEAAAAFVQVHAALHPQIALLRDLRRSFAEKTNKFLKIGRYFKFPKSRDILEVILGEKDEGFFKLFFIASNANIQDYYSPKHLLFAVKGGYEAFIQLLLERGVDTEAKDKNGWTPLLWAASNGREPVVRLLLEHGADVGVQDNNGRTPLLEAASNGREPVVRLLLEHGADVGVQDNNNGRTPLLWAASNGREPVVRLLLEHGADVGVQDNDGWTPLLKAASNGWEHVVRLLLEHGADVGVQDNNGRTPLLEAASNGQKHAVRLLLEHGADVGVQDNNGRTPLLWAASNGREPVVRLLLEHGADIEAKDNDGWTPLLKAASNGWVHVVRLLLEHGADVGVQDNDGWTPLLKAASNGWEHVVRLLLEHGADVGVQDNNNGRTPLLWAASNGREPVVRLLLEHGADIEAKDNDGWTPLLEAASNGREPVVRLLLEHGADVGVQDSSSQTPLLRAAEYVQEVVVKLLPEKSVDKSLV